MRVSRKNEQKAGIDLSPMLDVIFQLILFFLVSTTFSSLPGINVKLPQSVTATSRDATGATITVLVDGTMYLNDEEVTFQTMDSKLAALDVGGRERVNFPIAINADSEVTNGNLVKIFDSLRKNGFSSVSLRTSSRDSEEKTGR